LHILAIDGEGPSGFPGGPFFALSWLEPFREQ
jgi:hypothetical protein